MLQEESKGTKMNHMAFALIALLLISSSASANVRDELNMFGGSDTSIRNVNELRDPFKRNVRRSAREREKIGQPRTQFVQNVPSVEGIPLSAIRVVGVLLGEERRAVAKIVSNYGVDGEATTLSEESYVLREGMRIGENNAEIKAILPGGVVLVEKIRNVYDQDEYLETIIPITRQ